VQRAEVTPTLHKPVVARALLPMQGRRKQRFSNCRQISPSVKFGELRHLNVSDAKTRARVPVLHFQFAALGVRLHRVAHYGDHTQSIRHLAHLIGLKVAVEG